MLSIPLKWNMVALLCHSNLFSLCFYYCVIKVLHILTGCAWVSNRFTGYLEPCLLGILTLGVNEYVNADVYVVLPFVQCFRLILVNIWCIILPNCVFFSFSLPSVPESAMALGESAANLWGQIDSDGRRLAA